MKKFNELSDKLKKNILNLHYNKNLQYFNTTTIILFTYFIGLTIALLTKQINFLDHRHLYLFSLVSIIVLGPLVIFLLYFKNNMKKVVKGIKKLKL